MLLPEDDAQQFFKLFSALLVFVNGQKDVLEEDLSTPDDFMQLPTEQRVQVRNELYEDTQLIESFVQENPFHFSSDELEIVRSWKHYVKGEFSLFRHLKKYTIFLSTSTPAVAYGVLSLTDALKDMFPYVPVLVQGVLLPFKNQIVYDGYLGAYNISFGGGTRRMFNNTYNEAKADFGIVTSLPFEPSAQRQTTDEEKLKFYLKNARNRQYYWDEIEELIEKNHDLAISYHQEMGKINSRTLGKRLRGIGFRNVWFGILQGMTVCSGKTKDDLEKNISSVVPKQMQDFVYRYHLKESKK